MYNTKYSVQVGVKMSEKTSCGHCGSTNVSARIIYAGPGDLSEGTRFAIECHRCNLATSEPYWETLEEHLGKNEKEWLQWGEVA
jgi:hypothetical protein